MARMRVFMVFVLAITAGGALAFGTYNFVQRQPVRTASIPTRPVVVAAGTKIDRETDKNKPMPVSVVTLLVNPEEAERLTLASTEGKIQLALRNPLDKAIPATPGVRPAALFGFGAATRTAVARTRVAS